MDAQVLEYYHPLLQKFLQGLTLLPFHHIPYLLGDFKKSRFPLEENENTKEKDDHLPPEVSSLIEKIREVTKKKHLTSEELEKEIVNILTSEVLELKRQINEMNIGLWEKALNRDLTEEEIKQFEVLDKFFFLQSNILGIIGESRNIKVIKELIGYSLILTLRMLEVIENNMDIGELEDDFKVVAKKIKSIIQKPKALDDYFIDELFEEY